MWESGGRWYAHAWTPRVHRGHRHHRATCLEELRKITGDDVELTVEVIPSLAGVAECAEIMGWDKRRVITYLNRGSFPEPMTALASGRIWRREDVEEFARRGRRAAAKASTLSATPAAASCS